MSSFKVGEIVQVGDHGEKGKIIDIYKPLGTYNMYKVHMMGSGEVKSASKHELVKGLADDVFQNLFDCYQQPQPHATTSNATMSLTDILSDTTTFETINEIDLYETQSNQMINEPVAESNSKSSRFVELPVSPNSFISNKENKRTKSKTTSHIKLLTEFLVSKQEVRSPEDIPPVELNTYLMQFMLCVRQQNGAEYEPSTLRNMLSSFDR